MDVKQTQRYEDAYRGKQALRLLARFDIRYRRTRLHGVAEQLGLNLHHRRVLDVGFGGGHLSDRRRRNLAQRRGERSPRSAL